MSPDARLDSGGAWSRVAAVAIAADRGLLLRFQLGHIGTGEIDRIEHQGREAGVRHRFGNDLPGKREEEARAFDQQERRDSVLGHVLQIEQDGGGEVDDEMYTIVRPSRNVELQRYLVHIVASALRIEIELDIELRLDLPGIN